jgi:hypothetical protein
MLNKRTLFEKANVCAAETSVSGGMIWSLFFGPFGEGARRA